MNAHRACFKQYDIRGKAPEQLNDGFAYALGLSASAVFRPARAVTGHHY